MLIFKNEEIIIFKKKPAVVKKMEQVHEMIESGKSREEIMAEMGIGMSTYYRYAKRDK